jgi:Domain of unknown function DUF29
MTLGPADLYEQDFYAWTQRQARELGRFAASRPNLPLDLAHLAEEIRDLGKERRDALRSWTTHVIERLLLLEHSVAREPRRGWVGEIVDFRRGVGERLTKTLRRDLARQLPRLHAQARRGLARKLAVFGEPETAAALPAECPYTLDQVLGDWWPGEERAAG